MKDQILYKRLQIFDGIEYKEAKVYNREFQMHFHKEWSLTSITYGQENIFIGNNELTLSKNVNILIPPYSIHKNWGGKFSQWSYRSIYIEDEIVKRIAKTYKLDYGMLSVNPYFISEKSPFMNDFNAMNEEMLTKSLGEILLNNLGKYDERKLSSLFDREIIPYIQSNFNKKITLDTLEAEFKINKFKLLRIFKKCFGMSPQRYLDVLRIENSKKSLFNEEKIVHIALDNGFYDHSHFAHSFKRHVGCTPFQYKRNITN